MKKFELFFCFLLAISYTQSEVIDGIDVDELYDKLINFAKGMAKTNEYKCSNILTTHRTAIYPYVVDIIKNLKNPEKLEEIFDTSNIKLWNVDGLRDNCSIDLIKDFLANITQPARIGNLADNIISNAEPISKLLNEYLENTDKDGKLIIIGKIIRIVTGISLN